MSLDQASCYFHPNREAVAKCENCNRMICLEDKMTYRSYGGMDRAENVYTYCPECYDQAIQSGRNIVPVFLFIAIIGIIAIGIFVLFGLFILGTLNNFPSF